MRRLLLACLVLAACGIAACELTAPQPGGPPLDATAAPGGSDLAAPIAPDAIEVTTLADAPRVPGPETPVLETPAQPATTDAPHPKPRPEGISTPTDPATTDPAATDLPPEVVKSPEQMLCEKAKGIWAAAGKSGIMTCVKRTRDGGKQCRKQTDCEGFCLARSRTCAPVKPLFGCNDILQADGQEATLCID